jgi:uncharacterized protein (TIGR03435 family)
MSCRIEIRLKNFIPALAAIMLIRVGGPLLSAQMVSPQTPTHFEVASVKRNMSGEKGEQIRVRPGGLLEVQNMSVRSLIQSGYGVMDSQISGGPGWINSECYDIVARSGGGTGAQDLLLMLRTLLEDRFELKTHREKQEMPAYLLTIADSGMKMQRAEGRCVVRDPANPPRQGDGVRYCGNMRRGTNTLDGEGVQIAAADRVTLGSLTGQLSSILGRPVVDRTGLTGLFMFHLQWLPAEGASSPSDSAEAISPDLSSASIFTALGEQLGLKLSSGKAPVEVLVVDKIERPSEN